MTVFVRLGWTFLTQTRGRRAGLFETTRVTTTTLPNDLDINRHVNNGRYLSLADLGRFDWFYRTGAMQAAFRHKAFPVIGDVTARYVKQARAFEKLAIETRILGWDDKWAFIETRLLNSAGELVTLVLIRGMFWSPAARTKGGIKPAELIRLAGHGEPESPALPEWVQLWSRALDVLSASAHAERAAGSGGRPSASMEAAA